MNLSTKSLNALASLKERLQQAPTPAPVIQEFKAPKKKLKRVVTARGSIRNKNNSAFQRACRNREWWAPTY